MTDSKFDIRRLSDCPLADAVFIWNESFQGYFADMTLTPEGYLRRLQNEDLSLELSFIAYSGNRPAGFLLNGIRWNKDTKAAWNGGTGVSPEFRKQGVGKALVRSAVELYAREAVMLATLEAISTNESAIALYRSFGYEPIDRLIFLRHEGSLNELASERNANRYAASAVAPEKVVELDFYRFTAPWQTQWQSLVHDGGQAVIVYDADGVALAYALFRKRFVGHQLDNIALYQCEVKSGRIDTNEILLATLEYVYGPLDQECRRTTNNLSLSNELVVNILRQAGFATFVEQVHLALGLQKRER